MDLERIERLIELMKQTGVSEISIEQPDYKVTIKRGGSAEAAPAALAEPAAQGEVPQAPGLVQVHAHMLGIFRHGDGEDPATRADVGAWVTAGQTLGTIEAMKVHSEVRSPVSGTVEEVLVGEEASVEYGQPLFTIMPKTEHADVPPEQA
jgi:acetyl-CoA carboxylase biotin carboxyl carrier protein